jgi:hypothetical protein
MTTKKANKFIITQFQSTMKDGKDVLLTEGYP